MEEIYKHISISTKLLESYKLALEAFEKAKSDYLDARDLFEKWMDTSTRMALEKHARALEVARECVTECARSIADAAIHDSGMEKFRPATRRNRADNDVELMA